MNARAVVIRVVQGIPEASAKSFRMGSHSEVDLHHLVPGLGWPSPVPFNGLAPRPGRIRGRAVSYAAHQGYDDVKKGSWR